MKFTTALTITALLLTSSFGFVNRANAQQVEQESTREQIEGVTQPEAGCRWPGC